VVPWLLEREYRRHRVLDAELPLTYAKRLASLDKRLEQEADEPKHGRIVKVVIHPAEIATWARREGREVNERYRSDYADLLWRIDDGRRRAGHDNAAMPREISAPCPSSGGPPVEAGHIAVRCSTPATAPAHCRPATRPWQRRCTLSVAGSCGSNAPGASAETHMTLAGL
jgi:hypothetical protein